MLDFSPVIDCADGCWVFCTVKKRKQKHNAYNRFSSIFARNFLPSLSVDLDTESLSEKLDERTRHLITYVQWSTLT